jgi:hypothetical protein
MTLREGATLLLLGMTLVAPLAALGQSPAVLPSAAKESASFREFLDAATKQVEIFAAGDPDEAAEPVVALRWANNARGSEDGLTLLYVHAGLPLATACLYPWDKKLVHDMESLSRDKIVARHAGDVVWHPQESSVKFVAIPHAPDVAETPAQRLRQLRALAEEFQSSMLGWKADSTDREQLRLLPRPLYRYQPKKGPIIDGAVFAFVMGTDPESLLLLEAVQGSDGTAKWEFAFARRTSGELEGRHQDKVVWHADRYPGMKDPNQPRFSIGQPIPPELLPAAAP